MSDFDVEIVEMHHKHKRDSPSGTALRVAEILRSAMGRSLDIKTCREGLSPRGNEIGVFGVRGGDVVGEHTVFFFGNGERIEITHRATNRECFASGAVKAALWLANVDKPGLYSMADVLGF